MFFITSPFEVAFPIDRICSRGRLRYKRSLFLPEDFLYNPHMFVVRKSVRISTLVPPPLAQNQRRQRYCRLRHSFLLAVKTVQVDVIWYLACTEISYKGAGQRLSPQALPRNMEWTQSAKESLQSTIKIGSHKPIKPPSWEAVRK